LETTKLGQIRLKNTITIRNDKYSPELLEKADYYIIDLSLIKKQRAVGLPTALLFLVEARGHIRPLFPAVLTMS
jgi:hypothetical protein